MVILVNNIRNTILQYKNNHLMVMDILILLYHMIISYLWMVVVMDTLAFANGIIIIQL